MTKSDSPTLRRSSCVTAPPLVATILWTLVSTIGCDKASPPSASVELSADTLRLAHAERLLPGRYDFRVLQGWLVRCDTAKGTCCAMENFTDETFAATFMKAGKEAAERSVPGGGTCKD